MTSVQRTIPGHVDSTGKVMFRLALVSKEQVFVDGKPVMNERQLRTHTEKYVVMPPDKIVVTPSILRNFSCTAGCTACCLPFTLDFTNDEFDSLPWTEEVETQAVDLFHMRHLEVNGTKFEIQTYEQYKDPSCPFLRPTRENGALGCGFWTEDNSTQPLECAAAPQLLMTTRGIGTTAIMSKPFGRGWKWQNKPQCEFDPVIDKISKIPDQFDLSNIIMLFERYEHWATYLGLRTWIPEIIDTLRDFPSLLRKNNLQSVVVVER